MEKSDLHAKCRACKHMVYKPTCYIVTKYSTSGKHQTFFCDDQCAERHARDKFQEEWA